MHIWICRWIQWPNLFVLLTQCPNLFTYIVSLVTLSSNAGYFSYLLRVFCNNCTLYLYFKSCFCECKVSFFSSYSPLALTIRSFYSWLYFFFWKAKLLLHWESQWHRADGNVVSTTHYLILCAKALCVRRPFFLSRLQIVQRAFFVSSMTQCWCVLCAVQSRRFTTLIPLKFYVVL